MNTTANIFNYIEMLKLENNEVNHIAEQDFTLDELKEFEYFVYTLGTAYNAGKNFEEKHNDFMRWTANYEHICDNMSLEEVEEADWLDEEFFTLKAIVEDMASMLVLDGVAGGFFSEARR